MSSQVWIKVFHGIISSCHLMMGAGHQGKQVREPASLPQGNKAKEIIRVHVLFCPNQSMKEYVVGQ